MIRLSYYISGEKQQVSFDKSSIVIGQGVVDLSFPDLNGEHLIIERQKDQFIVINVQNDPFTLLNGNPFKKKKLSLSDVIEIGTLAIHFEGEIEPVQVPKEILDSKFSHVSDLSLIQEEIIEKKEVVKPKKNFLSYATFSFIGVMALCLMFLTFYVKANKDSLNDQVIAAEGVSDVAMALAYAKIHGLKPKKQNWSDPEFIKNNLSSVLSTEYPSFANLENQGKFKNCPYILRIYTGKDLKQFLVIAQPEPSFLQWLIPKNAIVLNSNSMEIRELSDLKALNRILLNDNALDEITRNDLSEVLGKSSLIPLASLGHKKGFTPPKALGLIRPEVANCVYNAPRYYHLGDSCLKKTSQMATQVKSLEEVNLLQKELEELHQFPGIVLYSTTGLENTLEAQKCLSALAPHLKFLTAYVHFDEQGHIANSHLLLEGESLANSGHELQRQLARISEIASTKLPSLKRFSSNEVNPHHPLFLKLEGLKNEREHALEDISEKMFILLTENNETEKLNFAENFKKLLADYELKDREWHDKFTDAITQLKKEYSEEEIETYLNLAN